MTDKSLTIAALAILLMLGVWCFLYAVFEPFR